MTGSRPDERRVFPQDPWGAHRPGRAARLAIRATRSLAYPVVKQLALGIRHVVRPGLDHVDTRLWGHRVRLTARGNLAEGRLLFMPRVWDREERQAIRRLLGPGATFVDVGANAGGYTWWVLSLLGHDCRVLAVEPDPYLVESLRFTLKTNAIQNVALAATAVASEPGEAVLRIDPRNRGENRLEVNCGVAEGAASCAVRVRRLDELVKDAGLSGVDLMKIDIEGLEKPVLMSYFQRTPRPLWPRFLLTERKDIAEHRSLERMLVDHGYTVVLRTRRNVLCAHQGDAGGTEPADH